MPSIIRQLRAILPPVLLWPLVHAADTTVPDAVKTTLYEKREHLGVGLLRPFQRDEKGNFAVGSGQRLWESMVGQVLGTLCQSEQSDGQLLWRTEFGSLADLIRHSGNTLVTQEIARVYVSDALARWLPFVVVTGNEFERAGRALTHLVHFDVVDSRGNKIGTGNTARVPVI